MVLVVIAWGVCGILGALIGGPKGRTGEGAVAGFLLGPIGLLWIATAKDERRRCPFCREPVAAAATACPHCQREVPSAFNATCKFCGQGLKLSPATLGHLVRCPHCRKMTPTQAHQPAPAGAAGERR